jgi:hypothetical protein
LEPHLRQFQHAALLVRLGAFDGQQEAFRGATEMVCCVHDYTHCCSIQRTTGAMRFRLGWAGWFVPGRPDRSIRHLRGERPWRPGAH